jgi:hypothetical protein
MVNFEPCWSVCTWAASPVGVHQLAECPFGPPDTGGRAEKIVGMTTKMWLLSGVAVFALAVVVVLVVVLTRGPDTSTPEGAAEAAVDAFADKDAEALAAVSCSGASNPLDQVAPSPLVGAELGAVRLEGTDEAVAKVTVTYTDSTSQTEMGLARENGEWCLAWFGS